MQQSGEYRIAAPIETVWAALNDPEILKASIEGCERLERTADDAFTGAVRARVGPVSAAFTGDVVLKDVNPPNSYTLEVSAKGGAAGFGKGVAKVSLRPEGTETVLTYDVEGQIGGKLAQIGQRLVDGAARKMADDFFQKFGELVAPAPAETPAAPETAAPYSPAAEQRLPIRWIAVGGLALALLLALFFAFNPAG